MNEQSLLSEAYRQSASAALDSSHIIVSVLAGLLALVFVEIEKAAFRRVWQPASTGQDVA